MNTKLASLLLAVAFAVTACTDPDRSSSGQKEPNDRPLNINSTPTPTATVLPAPFIGLQLEPAVVLSPFPTQAPHPVIDTKLDPFLFPWFDVQDWRWFPLTVP